MKHRSQIIKILEGLESLHKDKMQREYRMIQEQSMKKENLYEPNSFQDRIEKARQQSLEPKKVVLKEETNNTETAKLEQTLLNNTETARLEQVPLKEKIESVPFVSTPKSDNDHKLEAYAQRQLELELEIDKLRQNQQQIDQEALVKQKMALDEQIKQQRRMDKRTRLALLVGNSEYIHVGKLNNPTHDVKLIAQKLTNLGFQVTTLYNANTLESIETQLDQFAIKLMNAGSKLDCCLFYYAGHGIQSQNMNYLIPTAVNLLSETDIKYKCMNLDYALEKLTQVSDSKSVQIMIIDACRNELNTRGIKMTSRSMIQEGFYPVIAPSGSLALFSTSAGKKAFDTCEESNQNSPFALALGRVLDEALNNDVEITQLTKAVTRDVKRMTDGMQIPYISGDIDSDFYFFK